MARQRGRGERGNGGRTERERYRGDPDFESGPPRVYERAFDWSASGGEDLETPDEERERRPLRGIEGHRTEWGEGYAHDYGREGDYGHERERDWRRGAARGESRDEWRGVEELGPARYWGYGGGNPDRFGRAGRESRPNHTGRGPKGYRRSDERIQEDVCEQLTRHPDIDASDVEVRVQDGRVMLTGTVTDKHTKRMIEDVAEECAGVTEVDDQLRVVKPDRLGTRTSTVLEHDRGARAGGDREIARPPEREGQKRGRGRRRDASDSMADRQRAAAHPAHDSGLTSGAEAENTADGDVGD